MLTGQLGDTKELPNDAALVLGNSGWRARDILSGNFTWTLMGSTVYAACQWGVLIVLAKFGSPEMVGQFALGLAVTAPIILFANMQLANVLATDVVRSHPFSEYLLLRAVTTLVAVALIGLVGLASAYAPQTRLVIFLVGLAKGADAISDIFVGRWQRSQQMSYAAVAFTTNGVVSVAAVAAALWLTGSVVAAALASLAGSVAALVFCILRVAGRRGDEPDTTTLRTRLAHLRILFRLAVPLAFAATFVSLSANIPRYFVQHYWGERSLGFFAATSYVVIAGASIIGALGQSSAPRLSWYWTSGDTGSFRKLLLKLCATGALAGAVTVTLVLFAGGRVLSVLYQNDYAQYGGLLVWITLAGAVGYIASALGYAVNATRAFGRLVGPYLAMSIVAGISSWLLVPQYGPTGAAWAVGLTNVAGCVACLRVLYSLKGSRR